MSKPRNGLDILLGEAMKYELVLFDSDGTLFDFEMASEVALKNSYHLFGIDEKWNSDTMTHYRKLNKQIWNEFEQKKITPTQLKPERFRRFLSEISEPDIDPKKFSDNYLKILSEGTYLIENAEEIVKWCSEKLKIGIITNGFTSVQKPRFSESILDQYFEHYIISEEIGFAKPFPEIFEYAFNKFDHTNKDTAIIIGDNLTSDIKGGNNFGIDTCWLNEEGQENSGIIPTYEIKNLLELKNILTN